MGALGTGGARCQGGPLPRPVSVGAAPVVTADLVRDVFDMDCVVVPDPVAGTPMIVPVD